MQIKDVIYTLGFRRPWSSQRLQELDDGVLLRPFQFFKLLDDMGGLTTMPGDSFEKC